MKRRLLSLLLLIGLGIGNAPALAGGERLHARSDQIAYNFFWGAAGGVVAPPWATNQLLQMPYECLASVWLNAGGATGGAGAGAHWPTGTGTQAKPFLALSDLYAAASNVTLNPGTCINMVNSASYVEATFDTSLLSSGNYGIGSNTPTGYRVFRSTDGDGNLVPAAGAGITPDTINAAAAHLIFSQCGACSSVSGDPAFIRVLYPFDFVMFDGLNIEGVGSFTTQNFYGCMIFGDGGLPNYNAVISPTHFGVRNSYIHGCGGAGIASISADWAAIQDNVVTNTSGAHGYEESGIGLVSSQAACATYFAHCPPIQSGYDATIGTVIDGRLIPYHQVVTGNWTDGHYEFGQPGTRTDGNCIIIDTSTISQGAPTTQTNAGPYQYRALIANNVMGHCGGRGLHLFFAQFVDAVNNTVFAGNFDPQEPSTGRNDVDCFITNDCNPINNVVSSVGGTTTIRTAYTGGSVGPVAVDNVIPFLTSWTQTTPSPSTPMQVTMQDTTANTIVAVTRDTVNVSTTPGGLSGTMTFGSVVSTLNGALDAVVIPVIYANSPNNSSFGASYSGFDATSDNTVSTCDYWAQQQPLPCTGGNALITLMNSIGNSWLYNRFYGTNGISGGAVTSPNPGSPAAVPPILATAPGFNTQASDPLFTRAGFTITPHFILATLPTKTGSGSGYSVGCVGTLAGGSPATAAQFKVDSVSGSAIATWHIWNSGFYPGTGTTAFTQSSSTCGGTGAVFSGATFYQPLWIDSVRPDVTLQSGSPAKAGGNPNWCLTQDRAGNARACPSSQGAYE